MTKDPQMARYEFKRDLEELRKLKGRATELVSLYIPPGKLISETLGALRNEYSQSSNIKSKSTRKNVTAAIESIMARLKGMRMAPDHGLVLFVGHVVVGNDQTRMVQFMIEPPEPVHLDIYRCDSKFFLEPLERLLEAKESYGLIVIDRSEATVGLLKGNHIEVIKNKQSLVPRKHGRGGQSARRFERLIEEAAHNYFKEVGELASEAFMSRKIKGVLIGGPGATKEFFAEKEYLHHEVRKIIIGLYDTGYTDEYGLRELVEAASDDLAELELMTEKKLVRRLIKEIVRDTGGMATYGEDHVRKAIHMGAVDTLLVSEALRKYRIPMKCPQCGFSQEITSHEMEPEAPPCPSCGTLLDIGEPQDVIKELVELTESMGGKVSLISEESEEGEMLVRAFGGMAAILRYSIDRF